MVTEPHQPTYPHGVIIVVDGQPTVRVVRTPYAAAALAEEHPEMTWVDREPEGEDEE